METIIQKPIRDELALMALIERAVQFSSIPLTSRDVHEKPEVAARVRDSDHVARILSNLHKTKRIGRVPYTQRGTNIRFAYSRLGPIIPAKVSKDTEQQQTQQQVGKASIAIRQAGGLVIIELPQLTITVETK